jgi:hypothetical protein
MALRFSELERATELAPALRLLFKAITADTYASMSGTDQGQ